MKYKCNSICSHRDLADRVRSGSPLVWRTLLFSHDSPFARHSRTACKLAGVRCVNADRAFPVRSAVCVPWLHCGRHTGAPSERLSGGRSTHLVSGFFDFLLCFWARSFACVSKRSAWRMRMFQRASSCRSENPQKLLDFNRSL